MSDYIPKVCKIEDCDRDTNKGAWGYCGKHYQRVKAHGDPHYIMPESVWRQHCRNAQPNLGKCRQHVYKKYLGRHEHRVIAEQKIGRPLVKGEVVHHIDGNCHNNDPENLEIITQSEHLRRHYPQMMAARKEKCGY